MVIEDDEFATFGMSYDLPSGELGMRLLENMQ